MQRLFIYALIAFSLLNCSATQQISSPSSLKILSYNVRNARGMDDVVDFDRTANVIKRINADCVALQELDSATERSGGTVVLEELSQRTGMYASYNKSIDYQGGGYGIGVLTKEKPLKTRAISLPGTEEKRSLLLVELKNYVICCTHWSLTQSDRLASVEIINDFVDSYIDKPVFLTGDLNAVPTSDEIRRISDKWEVLNDISQLTIPVKNPTRCIDYVMVKKNPKNSVIVSDTKVEAETVASDHRPVWAAVAIKTKK